MSTLRDTASEFVTLFQVWGQSDMSFGSYHVVVIFAKRHKFILRCLKKPKNTFFWHFLGMSIWTAHNEHLRVCNFRSWNTIPSLKLIQYVVQRLKYCRKFSEKGKLCIKGLKGPKRDKFCTLTKIFETKWQKWWLVKRNIIKIDEWSKF